jgi:NIMA (never in mitosis gene a)-related kinase 8
MVKCGSQHVVALSSDQQIFTWGACKFGSLGLGNQKLYSAHPIRVQNALIDEIKEIFCGPDTTIILNKSGEGYCCGKNNFDKLGFGKKVGKVLELVW